MGFPATAAEVGRIFLPLSPSVSLFYLSFPFSPFQVSLSLVRFLPLSLFFRFRYFRYRSENE